MTIQTYKALNTTIGLNKIDSEKMEDVRCKDEMTRPGTARTEVADVSTPRADSTGIWQCPTCGAKCKSEFGLRIHIGMMHKNVAKKLFSNMPLIKTLNNFAQTTATAYVPSGIIYDDWCNYLPVLEKAYKTGLFVCIVGPKGTGKTTLVRKFAEQIKKPLYTINFSLRTKESHLVGATLLENGSTKFALGIIPKSMQEGALLYLDELNCAEPDVLIRLDEALDDRRELVLKEAGEIITVKAKPDWFVIATINPLSHTGTKELPPQLLSRFPVRLYLDYPPADIEKRIVKMYVNGVRDSDIDLAIKLAGKLREAAKVEDIYYSPSIRETIAYAKLVESGVEPRRAAELVFANVYFQWGDMEVRKVRDLIASLWGEPVKEEGVRQNAQ
jgi:nitric oxide reductase NorQ protein